jgi:hypothetical protein
MEQSPSEATSYSGNEETLRILWSPNFRHRIDKSQPLVPTLSQMNPVCALSSYFF